MRSKYTTVMVAWQSTIGTISKSEKKVAEPSFVSSDKNNRSKKSNKAIKNIVLEGKTGNKNGLKKITIQ